ncbi:DUF885 domain-containing protein [Shewanella surugensis]|uniref:DUF885 domain-containing protein n=1 Tax=Shewanella surugensis TaxID=212020 RepID=A0ABT0LFP7_9GAMM|nr:DUF885 domain-containing protein [Shewanella surugensis]MCL1126536.1 DUF885 domain-containing protein [Shewanella surugensis]
MKTSTNLSILALSISLTFASAGVSSKENTINTNNYQSNMPVKSILAETEAEKANALFEAIFMKELMADPMEQTRLGMKTHYGEWGEIGDKADDEALKRANQHLIQLSKINPKLLDKQTLLSFQLLTQKLKQKIANDKWRYHNYPISQMRGSHAGMVSFLINHHTIDNIDDAKAYISRLNGMPKRLNQVQSQLRVRAHKGIIAPSFIFPYVISDSQNIIIGAPFDGEKDSVLWEDFNKKVHALKLPHRTEQALFASAKKALTNKVQPAYIQFISYVNQLSKRSNQEAGVWKFPDGEAFYKNALDRTTTTTLSADEIYQIGLSEVERIHDEMRAIMKKVGFKGTLQEFFVYMRDSKQFYYPDTEQGKTEYLQQATALIDNMTQRLDESFKIKPKAPMIVKKVEAFREKSAGKAFYNHPSADGTRPGIYYANLYKMEAMPKYQMEALAYHEGIPGHHMQLAIAQELEGIPKFRKFGGYTAYIEGWGLYSEYFPKEMGLYSDPYSDFGRLSMELWRACRLVVDTGIHQKKWTREQGIQYYVNNTPNAKSDAIKMVERHIVMPSQATAYKIGMLKILELRHEAQQALGTQFDIRDFHTLILSNGALPLNKLEDQIDDWIKQTKG